MSKPRNDGVMLENLALEIAEPLALAASDDEQWDKSNAMSLTISTTLHKIGHLDEGVPGVIQYILLMVNEGKITVRSARNHLPPVFASDVTVNNFRHWYVSQGDANKVRALLLPVEQMPPAAVKVETDTGTNVNRLPSILIFRVPTFASP